MALHAAPASDAAQRLLATRTRDAEWTARATVEAGTGSGRMVLRLDGEHWCAVIITSQDVRAVLSIKPGQLDIGRASRPGTHEVTLWMRARVPVPQHNAPVGPDILELGFTSDGTEVSLGSTDGRYLSTEVAGGFTGRVIGIQPDKETLRVKSFSYIDDKSWTAPCIHDGVMVLA